MKKSLFLLSAAFFGAGANLVAEPVQLDTEFQINERFFALTSAFDLQNKTETFGKISKKFFTLNTEYMFEDSFGELIAKGESQFFTWGTTVDVHAANGDKLGWIEEQLSTWLSPSKYRVYNGTNRLVATAQMNLWGTTFTVMDPNHSDKEIALISRPWFQLSENNWKVEILDPERLAASELDPRLLVMVAVYRTDSENRAANYRKAQKGHDWYLDQNTHRTRVAFLDDEADHPGDEVEGRIQTLAAELGKYSFPEPEENSMTRELLDKVEEKMRLTLKKNKETPAPKKGLPISGKAFHEIEHKAGSARFLEILEEFAESLDTSERTDEEKGQMLYLVKQLIQNRNQ